MSFAKWGMAAAVALALSPAYADDYKNDAQQKATEAQQDAAKEKADAQKDAAKQKADAQKKMSEADADAAKRSAQADQKANEKISDARKDETKQEGREVRASDDRTASTAGDSKKGPLSATAQKALRKLHDDSEKEVTMARAAKDKAQNDKVKDLASTIEKDHSKMVDKTADIARDHNVELAAGKGLDKDRAHVDQMTNMQGAAFDKHYADMMAQEHRKDLAELRKIQPELHANKADADVAKLVDDAVDKMTGHEKMAIDAQTALKKDQRQGRRSGMSGTSPSSSSGTSTWPQTDANTSSGADVSTGPHTGADADAGHTGAQGDSTSTRTQSPASNPTDNRQNH